MTNVDICLFMVENLDAHIVVHVRSPTEDGTAPVVMSGFE